MCVKCASKCSSNAIVDVVDDCTLNYSRHRENLKNLDLFESLSLLPVTGEGRRTPFPKELMPVFRRKGESRDFLHLLLLSCLQLKIILLPG